MCRPVPDTLTFGPAFAGLAGCDGDLRLRAIVEASVGQVFGVSEAEFGATTRGRARTAFARQIAMYLSHVVCGRTLTDVGRQFARDRTTVAHACAHIEDRRDDPRFDRTLDLLEAIVRWRLGGGFRAEVASSLGLGTGAEG